MYTDAHIHLFDLGERNTGPSYDGSTRICASALNKEQFLYHEEIAGKYPGQVFLSFGIHPQDPDRDGIAFLEQLVLEKRVDAIGECGLDLYTDEYRSRREDQEFVWNAQLELAQEYGLPVVLHVRKAMPAVFAETAKLRRLSSVVFHGWGGSAVEARSLLDRGIPAFFSAGKGLLRGHKGLRETVRTIDPSRILAETDAPWMTLKGESVSLFTDIGSVYREIALLRDMTEEALCPLLLDNFTRVFVSPGESQ